MVEMFVSLCFASKKSSEREFFVPARTHLGVKLLTLSRLGTSLVRHLALRVHISFNNDAINMVQSGKLVVNVLALHCAL